MNTKEAQFLLSSIRPDSEDAEDPRFAEAIELAKSDPELGAWLENQQAVDRVLSSKLQEIPVPEDLEASILAGIRVSQNPPFWKSRSLLLIAATLIAILLPLGLLVMNGSAPSGTTPSDFRAAMIEKIESGFEFDHVSADSEEIRDWLVSQSRSEGIEIPDDIAPLKTAGCKLLDWEGKKASLICFHLKPDDPGPTVHLVTVDAELFAKRNLAEANIEQGPEWVSALWRKGGKTYFLATIHSAAALQEWIE